MKTIFVTVFVICLMIPMFAFAGNAKAASGKNSGQIVAQVGKNNNTARATGDNISDETLNKFAYPKKSDLFDNGTFGVNGFARLRIEGAKYMGKWSSYIRTYVNLNLENMGTPGLSFHFYGSMQNSLYKADESLDLYYGYIRYKTFQDAIDVMAGRFEMINNKFMTVDGAQASFMTPVHLGVTLYGGVPSYKNFEDRKVVFRKTGDLTYGARVFLTGFKNIDAYIGYSRETGKADDGRYTVFHESLNAGGFYKYDFSKKGGVKSYLTIGADAEYDPFHGALSQLSAQVNYKYSLFGVKLYGDMYDIQDIYPEGRELIIQLFSNGREKKVGGDLTFDVNKMLTLYAGAYGSMVELKNNENLLGLVYQAGFDLDLTQSYNLMFSGEVYYYDTDLYKAAGGILSGEWRINRDFALDLSGEMASMMKSGQTVTAYSIDTEFKAYLLKNLEASVYFSKGENNRFIDDIRCGLTVKYEY